MQSVHHKQSDAVSDKSVLSDRQKEIIQLIIDIRRGKTDLIVKELDNIREHLVRRNGSTDDQIARSLMDTAKLTKGREATNEEIADILGCEAGTIRAHLVKINNRISINTKEELANWGAEHPEMLVIGDPAKT